MLFTILNYLLSYLELFIQLFNGGFEIELISTTFYRGSPLFGSVNMQSSSRLTTILARNIYDIMGTFLWYSWPPAKNTINQFITHTPKFWYYCQIISIIGTLITLATLTQVEQRWYKICGLGWLTFWSAFYFMVSDAFLWIQLIIGVTLYNTVILIFIIKFYGHESTLSVLRALILFCLTMLAIICLFTAFCGKELYCTHIHVSYPGTGGKTSIYYNPAIDAYKTLNPLHNFILQGPVKLHSLNDIVIGPTITVNLDQQAGERLWSYAMKALEPGLTRSAARKFYHLWPINDQSLYGELVHAFFIAKVKVLNPGVPDWVLEIIFKCVFLQRYNSIHKHIIPFNDFLSNYQAMRFLLYSLPRSEANFALDILAGIPGMPPSKYYLHFDPETIRILKIASDFKDTYTISFYDWMSFAHLCKASIDKPWVMIHAISDFYTNKRIAITGLLSILLIIIIHWLTPYTKWILAKIGKAYSKIPAIWYRTPTDPNYWKDMYGED